MSVEQGGTRKVEIDGGPTPVSGNVGVLNDADTRINPATEEGIQEIVTAIEAIPPSSNVQYTEGDVDASVTGTATMMRGAGDVMLPIPGTTADGQLVNLGANNDVTVTGTVDLGPTDSTYLSNIDQNTGAALGSLGNLDAWDESSRAKVNPIVGQAGVQGGSGTVSANTQRTVLATDVGLPAGTNALGTVGRTLTARSFADSNVSVGTSSGTVLASNGSRKSLYITNTSPTAVVSLNITDAAVLRQGITLVPGATWQMTDVDFTTAAITGIASAATTSVSVMEIT